MTLQLCAAIFCAVSPRQRLPSSRKGDRTGNQSVKLSWIKAMFSQQPSRRIDAAICDLIAAINSFSDNEFDAQSLQLEDAELELIVVNLLRELNQSLTGQQLVFHLLKVRQSQDEIVEEP